MKKTDKYVYIITCDEPIKKELALFRYCSKNHIFMSRFSLKYEEILRLFQSLSPDNLDKLVDERLF